MMERTPKYRMKAETQPPDQGVGEYSEDIRDADEAEEEEDLVEVVDKLFSIILEFHDTMHESVRSRHTHHVDTTLSLTMQ